MLWFARVSIMPTASVGMAPATKTIYLSFG